MSKVRRGSLWLVLLLTLFFIVNYSIEQYLNSSVWQVNRDQKPVTLFYPKGASASSLLTHLEKYGALSCYSCLKLYLRLSPVSQRFQAGTYLLAKDITIKQLLKILLNGDVWQQQLTIIEGQTTAQVFDTLAKLPNMTGVKKLSAAFMASCQFCQQQSIEGVLLADTYQFPAGSTSLEVIKRSHRALLNGLKLIWQNRQSGLPFESPYELLVAASIIEKETALDVEKPFVAAVIVNRMHKKMRLQMDPTVIYALADNYHYPLKKADLKVDNPYNTYRYRGLPPTPICNVGLSSLKAAAHPANVDYLYFVATKRGGHHFSSTLKQQKKAIQRYLKSN